MKKYFLKKLCFVIAFCTVLNNNIFVFADNNQYNYEKDYIVEWDCDNGFIASNDYEWGYLKSKDCSKICITFFNGDINSQYINLYKNENNKKHYCLTVPSKIDGISVFRIHGIGLNNNFDEKNNIIDKMIIEDGIEQIGQNNYDLSFFSYSNSCRIKEITIPDSINIIFHYSSFCCYEYENKNDNMTIISSPDSYARQFADQHNCNWRCINHQNIITTIDALEPTYERDGHTKQTECSECGAIIEKSVIIPKLVKKQDEQNNKNQTINNNKFNFVYNFSKYSYSAEIVKIKKQKKKVTIPSTIIANNINYKVTDILKNAFRHNKKIKKIIIGKNIISIGDNAFNGCKNLKNIIIKTNKLNFVGESAFKNIKKNARIFIPAKKYKKYKRFFKNIKKIKRKRKYKVIYLK